MEWQLFEIIFHFAIAIDADGRCEISFVDFYVTLVIISDREAMVCKFSHT